MFSPNTILKNECCEGCRGLSDGSCIYAGCPRCHKVTPTPNTQIGDEVRCEKCHLITKHAPFCPCSISTIDTVEDSWEKDFVEKGAALEHIRWAKWQHYLHTFLVWNNDIQMWTLPHEKKEHWDSQIRTHYKDLSEHEKEMDRKEVRTYLPFIRSLLAATTARAEKKGYFEGYDFAREEIKIAALIADDKKEILKMIGIDLGVDK